MQKNLYLDYNATTPLSEDVFERMLPYFREHFGNPSSAHSFGWKADIAIQKSKKQIASVLSCEPKEIYFTSGATESNNWAWQGIVRSLLAENPKEKIHVITSPIEHKSILAQIDYLKDVHPQVEVSLCSIDTNGVVDFESIQKLIRPTTKLISIMWVNNETGIINPIEEIGKLAREKQIYFHTDATQSIGKFKIDLANTPVDLLTFSGHKIYGPKGIGALYIKSAHPHVQISPLIYGGEQQNGLRGGTHNVSGIVGLGAACEWIETIRETEISRIGVLSKQLRNYFNSHPQIKINNSEAHSVPHTLSLQLSEKCEDFKIQKILSQLSLSSTSACSSKSGNPSHVLLGIGLSPEEARRSLRLSLGHYVQSEDIVKITSSFDLLNT